MAVNRRSCALLQRSVSPVDGALGCLFQAVRRLQAIYEYGCAGQYDRLLTRPQLGGKGKTTRAWTAADFLWLQQHNFSWEEVLQTAYNLYRAQLCIPLWSRNATFPMATMLAIYACIALAGESMPQMTPFIMELCTNFGASFDVAWKRASEMRKWLCAWAVSFEDAGVQRTKILCPESGGISDGLSGWRSDKRRPIPELELAAVSAQVVSKHWREVVRARVRSTPIQSYPVELDKARVLAAKAGTRYRPGTEPQAPKRLSATAHKPLGALPKDTPPPATQIKRNPSPTPFSVPPTSFNEVEHGLPESSLDAIVAKRAGTDEEIYAGILIHEREYFLTYDSLKERRKGHLVPEDVESAIDKWLARERKARRIPPAGGITEAYLLSLGILDNEKELRHPGGIDYGPWITRLRAIGQMSPVEALLRAGVRPMEFPLHYIPHSLAELHKDLDLTGLPGVPPPPRLSRLRHGEMEAQLAPEGVRITDEELEKEMKILWSDEVGSERVGKLFCTPEEVAFRRAFMDLQEKEGWEEGQTDGSGQVGRSGEGRGSGSGSDSRRTALLSRLTRHVDHAPREIDLARQIRQDAPSEGGGPCEGVRDEKDEDEEEEEVRLALLGFGGAGSDFALNPLLLGEGGGSEEDFEEDEEMDDSEDEKDDWEVVEQGREQESEAKSSNKRRGGQSSQAVASPRKRAKKSTQGREEGEQ